MLFRSCKNKFRTVFDLNQYVIKYWQYMEGNYEPQSLHVGKFFTIGKDDDAIDTALRKQQYKMICMNDDSRICRFEEEKQKLIAAFEAILPEKSSFEK